MFFTMKDTETETPDSLSITDEKIEEVAVEACSHARSVERRLLGLPVKGRVSERVDRVLERRGLLALRAR